MILWIFSKNGRKKLSIKREIRRLTKEVKRLRKEHEDVKRGFLGNNFDQPNLPSPNYGELERLQRETNTKMDKIRKLELKLDYYERSWFWKM